jgi:hypothetical protein
VIFHRHYLADVISKTGDISMAKKKPKAKKKKATESKAAPAKKKK